ncbi:hypothetical protein QBC44DRAFT_311012 [Cladorrhinum sp. PSN332]|nr:hypothetical protein QBC44DRAFT_311012 [Cladorrhinum sp. PSN332]
MRLLPLLLAAAATTALAIVPGAPIFYGSTVPECGDCATDLTLACGPSLTFTPQHASCLCLGNGQAAFLGCLDTCVDAAIIRGLDSLRPERTAAREWLYYCIPFHPEVYCAANVIPPSWMTAQEQAEACAEARAQPTPSGGKAQPTPSGGTAQPAASGGAAQPAASGGTAPSPSDTSAAVARQVPAWALVAGLALVQGLIQNVDHLRR